MQGRKADQIVIMAHLARQRVDLVFTIGQRVLQFDDILHLPGLIEQRKQAFMLGAQRRQTGLDIGIRHGHIFAPAVRRNNMAGLAELGKHRLKLFLRHAQRVVRRAAALFAIAAAGLDVAARFSRHALDRRAGGVVLLCFQCQVGGQDEFGVFAYC